MRLRGLLLPLLVKRFPIIGMLFLGLCMFALLELLLLVLLAAKTGFLFTLVLIITTAAIGAALTRAQGMAVLGQVIGEIAIGRMPTRSILEGLMVLVGGILLIMPGLITDCIGITMLIPVCRRWYADRVQRFISKRFKVVVGGMPFGTSRSAPPRRGDVIDVDYKKEK